MGEVATQAIEFFAATVGLSAAAVMLFSRIAPLIGVVDVPGGRKHHGHPVPLVGGLAIFTALLAGSALLGIAPRVGYFVFALSIIIAAGLWDDVTEIRPRVKFAIQVAACALMIWGAGVQLTTVGDLFGVRPIGLWIFAVPLTIFAVVGVVNAVNMMDGMDGLAGCISFTAFAWFAVVAADSGFDVQFTTALILCGAIAGFLLFNLRFPWQPHARVFLGDAGSLMIGFALAWFAVDLTQGPGRTFPPICALWVVLVPLADCVSLMARRMRMRQSPFDGDRRHIHHYLLAQGYSNSQTLAILTGLAVMFGAVGYFGWRLHVPEPILFWTFAAAFFTYHFWIARAWSRIEGAGAQGDPEAPPASEPEEALRTN
jgi:UDP-GlcNAc:undecaprenyl-phosphate GlcNAc-1-phosphate transferase